jgi:hypothetical protein
MKLPNPITIFPIIIRRKGNEEAGLAGRGTRGDGHVDTEVTIVSEQLRFRRVEFEAVAATNGRLYTLVNGVWRCLPCQTSTLGTELQSTYMCHT